jgi:hypothetical protein
MFYWTNLRIRFNFVPIRSEWTGQDVFLAVINHNSQFFAQMKIPTLKECYEAAQVVSIFYVIIQLHYGKFWLHVLDFYKQTEEKKADTLQERKIMHG